MTKLDNILKTVGNTPHIKINKLAPEGINLYVKVEAFNPMGSVKDRLAMGVIEDAEKNGTLKPGQTVIEATSGNTGIGLAMVCAQKGYPLVVTMAENFSVERRKLMRFMGAKVVLTPAAEKGSGMLAKAVELADKHGWFLCHQFENEANANIHSQTTAQEIITDFPNGELDIWVTGYGTGGTLKGVSQVLRKESPKTKIVVCEPDNSALIASGIKQERHDDGSPSTSHPTFRPHLMQGWTPDFISKLTEDSIDASHVDQLLCIGGDDAFKYSKALAQHEGIFVGITSGATFAGAIEICKTLKPGSTVLCMLPDTGERYLSTQLFEDISINMTDEEMEISKSTPNCRFDTTPAPLKPANAPAAPPQVTEKAKQFINDTLQRKDKQVVMFALQWCEFCWSVRKFLKALNVDFISIDLDSTEYQANNWGGEIRAALTAQTNIKTIPQVFVGGKLIGGCTEVFDAYQSGELVDRFKSCKVNYTQTDDLDPYSLLPKWLQPR